MDKDKNIVDKIKDVFTVPEDKYIEDFRKKYIPKKYNQIELVEQLENDEIDHYISISNRTDGKSFNYIHYFIDYAIRKGVGFTLIARHYTVRFSYQKLIHEIVTDLQKKYDPKKFHFLRTDFYILVGYEDKELGIITDLNQATDLKYLSNYMKHFPIMIYDEFLALEGDYLIDEWDRLKTIYSSINRKEDIPYIKFPKIFYLGNAVNFSSPVLANLDIFEKIESHKINTMRQYGNVLLEMRRNEEVNDDRNLRAFNEELDSMTLGEFEINTHNIASDDYIEMINKDKVKIVIKLDFNYMVVEYHKVNKEVLLSVTSYEDDYDFNLRLVDNKETSIYLDTGFFKENHYKKYNNDMFKFLNQYSKDVILKSVMSLDTLNIYKVISVYESTRDINSYEEKEKQQRDTFIEQSKKGLFEKLFLS